MIKAQRQQHGRGRQVTDNRAAGQKQRSDRQTGQQGRGRGVIDKQGSSRAEGGE